MDIPGASSPHSASLPSLELSQLQTSWLKGARSRLLRLARINQARRMMDVACGWGQVTFELADRCQALVTGIDLNHSAIEFAQKNTPHHLLKRTSFQCAAAERLPVGDQSQDILFIQCGMLWMQNKSQVLEECRRVLAPRGTLVMLEPDYGGLAEHPPEIESRELWLSALQAAGADAMVGRKLPSLCKAAGLKCDVYFFDRYGTADLRYLEFLKELPLSQDQIQSLSKIEQTLAHIEQERFTVHLPFWMIAARVDPKT